MPLIGTAGHVDHGKSTLIQRLTGRDPDRWAEEKRRGLTIDLGFAWATLPGGLEVSFVDVPGHERYLKNMLAGIEAIDIALLVVAADEGWMPQSEEHLAVLDLLEVDSGVVALTKCDLVDQDLLELAHLEVAEKLMGSSLETAAVIPVSGISGFGIDDLADHLRRLAGVVHPRDLGRPRLWVDRSFSASGAGTVVTGTLLDGGVKVGDRMTMYPESNPVRVRGIQSHEQDQTVVEPGRRVALNLSGVDHGQVSRGHMVAGSGEWALSGRFLGSMRKARYVDEVDRRGAYQVHIGSSVHTAQITGLDDLHAVFTIPTPAPMAVGDRFIVRDTGRKLVVGGGRVLDPSPGATRYALRSAKAIDPSAEPNQIATALLSVRGSEDLATLAAQSLGGHPTDGVEAGTEVFTDTMFRDLVARAVTLTTSEHDTYPLRVGLPLATLAERLGVSAAAVETIIDVSPDLERVGPDVSLSGREIKMDDDSHTAWSRARTALEQGLDVPASGELGMDNELLHLLTRTGELVRISNTLVYLPEQIDEITTILHQMEEEFTVADFRDATSLSRKYAVPILEWADKKGLTVRRGDTRTAR